MKTKNDFSLRKWASVGRAAPCLALAVLCGGDIAAGQVWTPVDDVPWAPRSLHAAVVHEGAIWIFGGGQNDEVWRSEDGHEWALVAEEGPWDASPSHHSVFSFDGFLWLSSFGPAIADIRSQALWKSVDGMEWTLVLEETPWRGSKFAILSDEVRVMTRRHGVWSSHDGHDWVQVTAQSPVNHIAHGLVFQDKLWWLRVGPFDGRLFYSVWNSVDGVDWDTVLSGSISYPMVMPPPPPVVVDERPPFWQDGAVTPWRNAMWSTGGQAVSTGWTGYGWPTRYKPYISRSVDGVEWDIVADFPGTPRIRHAAVVFKGDLWLLGGTGKSSANMTDYLWRLSFPFESHAADRAGDGELGLEDVLRVIQLFNSGGYHCDPGGEDGFAPGSNPEVQDCPPHNSDYKPQDWRIGLSELLRLVQFFSAGAYHNCPEANTEDGFCPGPP